MAEKRMFSKTFTGRDDFNSMPDSSQNLYFHMGIHADDDGFVDNVKTLMKLKEKKIDDLKILTMKNFIIPFRSGVFVITHWKINNNLRGDRYKPTVYQEEKKLLTIDPVTQIYKIKSSGIPMVDQWYTNGSPSIVENSIEENNIGVGNNNINNNIYSSLEDFKHHQQTFKNEFPKIILDVDFNPDFDLKLMSEKLRESKDYLLHPDNSFKLSFLYENYEALVKDFYKERGKEKAETKPSTPQKKIVMLN